LELIDHPKRRIRMGQCGRKRVQEVLAWHHEKSKLLRGYAALAKLRRNRWKSLNSIRRQLFSSSGEWQQQP
jgi:hypothetical protein